MIQRMEESPPHIVFYFEEVEDRNASIEAGREIYKDVAFVQVLPAGGKDIFIDRAKSWLGKQKQNAKNKRIPQEHYEYYVKAFEAFEQGQREVTHGTPLKAWPQITPAQVRNLNTIRIYTVEDLAQANDDALSLIGMGARVLQQKAINWLETANGTGKISAKITEFENKLESAINAIDERDNYIAKLEMALEEARKQKLLNGRDEDQASEQADETPVRKSSRKSKVAA